MAALILAVSLVPGFSAGSCLGAVEEAPCPAAKATAPARTLAALKGTGPEPCLGPGLSPNPAGTCLGPLPCGQTAPCAHARTQHSRGCL